METSLGRVPSSWRASCMESSMDLQLRLETRFFCSGMRHRTEYGRSMFAPVSTAHLVLFQLNLTCSLTIWQTPVVDEVRHFRE